MCGHLRLLNIACAAKAKPRLVTLTKSARDSPLAFSLLGGQEKGFPIFIDAVEPGSKAAEVGLKRGDQVRYLCYLLSAIFSLSEEYNSQENNSSAVLCVRIHYCCVIIFRSIMY